MSITSSYMNKASSKFRIIFLGNQGVGKTSIVSRYITNAYIDNYYNTVGIDFNTKDITRLGQCYRLQMWDTAGQQRYRSLIPTYLKNAHLAVFVFDVSMKKSWQDIKMWYQMFKENQEAPCILIANKIDLSNKKVSSAEGEELALELKMPYMEVSAKTGKRIDQMFEKILDICLEQPIHELAIVNNPNQQEEITKQNKEDQKVILKKKKGFMQRVNCCENT